jgi:CRISPR-associated protein Cas1
VRSIVSAGLIPALGVFHRKRDNPFCLADDLIEPLRPSVDRAVKGLLNVGNQATEILNRYERKTLLQILTTQLFFKDLKRPLMVCLPTYVNSYFEYITKRENHFHIPQFK